MKQLGITTSIIVSVSISFMLNSTQCLKPGVTETLLGNGCKVTRRGPGVTFKRPRWYEMPLPHLNCSGTGITQFNAVGLTFDLHDVKSITLSYNDLIQLHVDDLNGFTSLVKIEVKSSKLQRVVASSQELTLSSVTYLSLPHNQLTKVPTEAMKSFPNLKVLHLYGNVISTIYDDDFRFNKHLERLYLGPNPLRVFGDAWLAKLNITKINLRGCKLTKIPIHFASMPSLEYAVFSDNHITDLYANTFYGCKELRWLSLASNKIANIHNQTFNGAGNLQFIDLSDNLLETLVPGTFDGASEENLQIDLYENPFNCNCSMAWFKSLTDFMKSRDMSTEIRYKCEQPARNHGKKSKQLTLDDLTCEPGDVVWRGCDNSSATTEPVAVQSSTDRIRSCPSMCVCYDESGEQYWPTTGGPAAAEDNGWIYLRTKFYPSVECLMTGLSQIPNNIMPDVQLITLTGNNITTLNINQLRTFQNLKTLNLKSNGIRHILPRPDVALPSLTAINLRFNKLASISKEQLRSFPNLKIISLYHNQFASFNEDVFLYNSKLTGVYLGPNPVQSFKGDLLENLSIDSLSLKKLSLSEVPAVIGNMVNLDYADLRDNYITILRNGTFSNCKKLITLFLANNRISTIEADAFRGASWLRYLKLSENLITILPATVFSHISPDSLGAGLWDNPFVCDCKMAPFKVWVDKRESIDPSTTIRFRCHQPLRMHNKLSNTLTADDFVCKDNDAQFPLQAPSSCPSGKIAVAIFVTFIITLLGCVVAFWFRFGRRYKELLRYAKLDSNCETRKLRS